MAWLDVALDRGRCRGLVMRWWTFGFPNMHGISFLAKYLLALKKDSAPWSHIVIIWLCSINGSSQTAYNITVSSNPQFVQSIPVFFSSYRTRQTWPLPTILSKNVLPDRITWHHSPFKMFVQLPRSIALTIAVPYAAMCWYCKGTPSSVLNFFVCFPVALSPNAGHGLLILEVSISHTTTHHSR